ncbi:MAG: LPS export ABC transporter periplasmic protein LptC [Ignavibacteria bacterium]
MLLIRFSFPFLLLMLVLSSSCDDKFKPDQINTTVDDAPSQESWNSTVIFSDSGKTKAILHAGHISVYTNKGFTLIDSGATVDFFKDEKKVSTLTGKRAKIDDRTKDIEIFDSITVINYEGSELKTQKLLWTNKTQKVSSDEFVRITTPTEAIEGIGFESDQNLRNYKIFKVSGTFSK